MQPSSILCRIQEAQQRDRAAGTTLANVRRVAEAAAAAWAHEALAADRREERLARPHATAEAAPKCEPAERRAPDDDPVKGFIGRW